MTLGLLRRETAFAFRRFASAPGSSLVIVLVLALGIGANGAILTLWERLLNHDFPHVETEERLVALFSQAGPESWGLISMPDFEDYRERARSFEALAGYSDVDLALRGPDRTPKLAGQIVTANYFEVLGVKVLRPGGGAPSGSPFSGPRDTVLSHDLWTRRFGRDPAIVGATIHVNGHPLTVVGVAPEGFRGTNPWEPAKLWVPMAAHRVAWPHFPPQLMEMRGAQLIIGLGRLRPETTLASARREIHAVAKTFEAPVPKPPVEWSPALLPVAGGTMWPTNRTVVEGSLQTLAIAAALLLLVVSLIAAGLTAGRLALREREMSVRMALGARRSDLLVSLLGEGLLLVLAGGGIGLLLSALLTHLLARFPITAVQGTVASSVPTPTAALGVFGLAGVAVTLWALPLAVFISHRESARQILPAGGRGAEGGRSWRLHELFITAEVALSMVLLAASGWVLVSWAQKASIELGFAPEGVTVLKLDLSSVRAGEEKEQRVLDKLLREIDSLRGVEHAALSATLPLSRYRMATDLALTPGTATEDTERINASFNVVTPKYFETLGIRRLRGRDFDQQDGRDAARSAVVNRTLAARLWPDTPSLGKSFGLWNGETFVPVRVVGVVRDTQSGRTLRREPAPHFYLSLAQSHQSRLALLVKSRPGTTVLPPILGTLRRLAPDLALEEEFPMEEHVKTATARERAASVLLGTAAAIALLLTGSGIFAFIALVFGSRREELAVRIVLGATRNQAVRPLVLRGLLFSSLGLLPGFLLTLWTHHLLAGWIPDLSSDANWVAPAVALLVLCVAVAATYLPARKAVHLDPADILNAG